MHQLNLALQLPQPDGDFSSYVVGPNAAAVAAVAAWATRTGDPFVYLFGIPGSGKTHLLQAACRLAVRDGRSAVYLPLDDKALTPSVLEDLEHRDLVALDDVQAVAGVDAWELGLFDLYNRLRESGGSLLASGDAPVSELPLRRAELSSRLGWGPGYRLLPLSEEDCERLLSEGAQGRGFDLGADAVRYIMRHCPREPAFLADLLDRIDRESLRTQRRPTLWLVRRILDEPDP